MYLDGVNSNLACFYINNRSCELDDDAGADSPAEQPQIVIALKLLVLPPSLGLHSHRDDW
jgi:hypothetical protein